MNQNEINQVTDEHANRNAMTANIRQSIDDERNDRIRDVANQHARRNAADAKVQASQRLEEVAAMRAYASRHALQAVLAGCFAGAKKAEFDKQVQAIMNASR